MRHEIAISLVYRTLSAMALLGGLTACATTGVIQGRMSGQPVQLQYRHSFRDQNGTITANTPNGQHFSGKFVVGTNSTSGIGIGAGSGDVGVFTGNGNTSSAAAVLMGDNGDSMHCIFTLEQPDSGLEGGGVGRCKLSTGQVVDATF